MVLEVVLGAVDELAEGVGVVDVQDERLRQADLGAPDGGLALALGDGGVDAWMAVGLGLLAS